MSAPIAVIGRSPARWLTRMGAPARFALEAVRARPGLPGAGENSTQP